MRPGPARSLPRPHYPLQSSELPPEASDVCVAPVKLLKAHLSVTSSITRLSTPSPSGCRRRGGSLAKGERQGSIVVAGREGRGQTPVSSFSLGRHRWGLLLSRRSGHSNAADLGDRPSRERLSRKGQRVRRGSGEPGLPYAAWRFLSRLVNAVRSRVRVVSGFSHGSCRVLQRESSESSRQRRFEVRADQRPEWLNMRSRAPVSFVRRSPSFPPTCCSSTPASQDSSRRPSESSSKAKRFPLSCPEVYRSSSAPVDVNGNTGPLPRA